MSNATLRQTATYTCTKNVFLSILAAAALHGEEAGEAKDEEVQRADHYGGGEAQIGTGAFRDCIFRPKIANIKQEPIGNAELALSEC